MNKTTAAKLVKIAAKEIGTKESPANSNKQKYGKWYGMNGEPWCDMFVSWVAAQAGQSDVGKYAYCPYHVNHFKKAGQWLGRTGKPKTGDIVFFANSSGVACHVGIVEKRLSSTSIQTIEGNTSTGSSGSQDNGGIVARRTRSYGNVGSSWYILGFARPAYSDSTDAKEDASDDNKNVVTTSGWTGKVSAKSGLNMRAKNSTSAKVITALPYGTKVKILKEKNGWGKIKYNGKTGWVYLQYVKKA